MSWKRELVARVSGVPPLRQLLRRLARRPSLIGLTYHRIGAADALDPNTFSATLEDLEWQGTWLRDNLRVLSGNEIAAFAEGRLTLDGPAACVTFDDGYHDNLRAGEVLARCGVPAVFFVVTSFVGSAHISDWDRLAYAVNRTARASLAVKAGGQSWEIPIAGRLAASAAVRKIYRSLAPAAQPVFVAAVEEAAGAAAADQSGAGRVFMTWDELRALRALGHTIGAHSHTHPILATVAPEQQRAELQRSKQMIEENLAEPVALMAYPVGKKSCFTTETKRLVAECGYAAAFSFYGGLNLPAGLDRFDLRRVSVDSATTHAIFQARALLTALYPM